MKEQMKEPFALPHDPAWDGLSAEEIYEELGHVNQNEMIQLKCSKGIQPGPDGSGFDEHIHIGDAIPDKGKMADSWKDAPESVSDNQGSNAQNDSVIEKLRQIIIRSAQMAERQRGNLPAHIRGIIQRLQKPELD